MPPLWTVWVSGACTVAWAWRRDRKRRQSAERLAAATLESLLNAIDANDQSTGQHVRRTAAYSLCIANALGLPDLDRRKIERVALFHDIGKIHAALFDIVHDDSQLSPAEREQIATHPQRGADVLAPLDAFYPELPDGVLAHHERWDGTGYPRRLRGEQIPLAARIVAIADTFDVVTHSRRYHAAEGVERGVSVIAEGRGTQFDPGLVDLFLSETTFGDVTQTLDRSRGEPSPRAGPQRAERRAEQSEKLVPDVRFRWRAPSTTGDEPADVSSATHDAPGPA